MQQYPGYPQPASAPTKPANNNLLWLALASLLCWCLAPISLVLGLLARSEALKRGAPTPGHARLAIILGSIGSGILVIAAASDAVTALLTPKPTAHVATPAVPAASSASTPPIRPSEEDQRAERAREAAMIETAKEITKNQTALETSMAAVDAALAAHQVGTARRTVDGLWTKFVSLDRAYLIPDENADAETRTALAGASKLLSRYEQLQKSVDANEMAAFNAAFETLWGAKNAQKDETKLYAEVGRKFGLTGAELQAIYRRNEAEADRRLKARASAETGALEAQCGPKPRLSSLDGGSLDAEEFVKRSAHDPSSVDVERCTEPVLNPQTCWTMTCDVRAKNALNANVLNQVRFTFRNRQVTGATGF